MHNVNVGWDSQSQSWYAHCQYCAARGVFVGNGDAMKWAQDHIAVNGGAIFTTTLPASTFTTASTAATTPVGNFFASDQILAVLLRMEQELMSGKTPHTQLEDAVAALAEAVRELSERVDELAHSD